MPDAATTLEAIFDEHVRVAQASREALVPTVARLASAIIAAFETDGRLVVFGNGGSAADAQHLATELTVRYKSDRAAIAALALTTDTSTLTAAGNDIGFERVFARQLEALGRKGDVAIAISTSGRSPNIIAALRQAKTMGLLTVGLGGKGGGDMVPLCDHLLVVPSDTTARIQEMHITLGQMLCGALEIELGHTGH